MKDKINISNKDWEQIARFLHHEMTPAEEEQFIDNTSENQQLNTEFEKSRELFLLSEPVVLSKKFNSNDVINKLMSLISEEKPEILRFRKTIPARFRALYKFAAILVTAIVLGSMAYFWIGKSPSAPLLSEIVSGNELIKDIQLPDGSVVNLNSHSKLVYPERFSDNNREVRLSGEAYFNITPDASKPFIIRTENAFVKVLGTSFNVNAYPENPDIEVVVESGKVLFGANSNIPDETSELFLLPGEKGRLNKNKKMVEKSTNKDPNSFAWVTCNLIFEKTELAEVAAAIEKVYRVNIQIEHGLEKLPLTARFDNRPVDFVLDVIKITFNLDLINNNSTYILQTKKETLMP